MHKFLLLFATFLFASFTTLYAQKNNFAVVSTYRISFEKSSTKGSEAYLDNLDEDSEMYENATEETNIFAFSFSDNILVHTVVKDKSVIQIYEILTREVSYDKEMKFVKITVKSGLSGSIYKYIYSKNMETDEQNFIQYTDNYDGSINGTSYLPIADLQLNSLKQE